MIPPDLAELESGAPRRVRPRPGRIAARRGARLVRAWWPTVLAVVLGIVAMANHRGWIELSAAGESLLTMGLATAVAGAILGEFMRFLVWWFWTRRQP